MKFETFSILFVLLICWYIYQPVPDGVSQPWKLRAISNARKIISDFAWLGDRLRLGTFQTNLNWLIPVAGSNDERIETMEFDTVPVRVYNLKKGDGGEKRPALVYFHGGGWMVASPEHYDTMMLDIVTGLDILIISVEYRLVDEKIKFPAPLEDCLIATRYLITNAAQFNVDPERVAIGGDASGGNMAAAASLKLRDLNFKVMPKLQLLINPMLQAVDFSLPSMVQNRDGPIIQRYYLAWAWSVYGWGTPEYVVSMVNNYHIMPDVKESMAKTYLNHNDIDDAYKYAPYKATPVAQTGKKIMWRQMKKVMLNPYFCPLLAEDLYDLPETYIFTTQGDPLRDEGMMYAKRLRTAKVPVTHIHAETGFYDVCLMDGFAEREQCVQNIIQFLIEKL